MDLKQAIDIIVHEECTMDTITARLGRRPEATDRDAIIEYVRAEYPHQAFSDMSTTGQAYRAVLLATDQQIRETVQLTSAQVVAERVARTHFAVATCEDSKIAWGRGPVYKWSILTLRSAIKAAYPDLSMRNVNRVVDVFQDCNDPIAHCVRYVREHKESPAYSR